MAGFFEPIEGTWKKNIWTYFLNICNFKSTSFIVFMMIFCVGKHSLFTMLLSFFSFFESKEDVPLELADVFLFLVLFVSFIFIFTLNLSIVSLVDFGNSGSLKKGDTNFRMWLLENVARIFLETAVLAVTPTSRLEKMSVGDRFSLSLDSVGSIEIIFSLL